MEHAGQTFTFVEVAKLGTGGMAAVFLATRKDDPSEKVAIKVPLDHLPDEVKATFLREAAAARSVAGPNVVQVVDWGAGPPPFIAFEYMDEGTLQDVLLERQRSASPWTEPELLASFRQLVLGMKDINANVIHRDLKPENIFVNGATLKISDFGISKYVGDLTRTASFKGWRSAPYAAPETFRGDSVDWRADQYSLAVMFFELTTFQRPFAGTNAELERAHLYETPARVTAKRPEISERLASVIAKMLEKQRDRRFGSWDEILREIAEISSGVAHPAGSNSDPILSRAVEAVEQDRAKRADQQRARDEVHAATADLSAIVRYWADEFFGAMSRRVESLNAVLAQTTYDLVVDQKDDKHLLTLKFYAGQLRFRLSPAPIRNEAGARGWGVIDLRTPTRLWLSNLLLMATDEVYGEWKQIDMKISPIMRQGSQPENRHNGRFEVLGGDRLVLGLDWEFLLGEWENKNVMSVVQYSETAFKFDEVLEVLLSTLTEFGPVPAPPPPLRRRGAFFDRGFPDV